MTRISCKSHEGLSFGDFEFDLKGHLEFLNGNLLFLYKNKKDCQWKRLRLLLRIIVEIELNLILIKVGVFR